MQRCAAARDQAWQEGCLRLTSAGRALGVLFCASLKSKYLPLAAFWGGGPQPGGPGLEVLAAGTHVIPHSAQDGPHH